MIYLWNNMTEDIVVSSVTDLQNPAVCCIGYVRQ